ncbi:Peptidyl-prolyl cis-trans isomerase H [Fulvia fulva]|uniref:peptidylprolyl isomerase n=1 Tax=Passalora fulva TaxID=5499 RepID=A0A9Q8LC18_PASFU|nr:Peptidyl-prolyl cis-trans isomerase H [Fulvia fulva]KAK4630301.1 Peptidyl-prolyl cis-trans isomerase H [Fulvia fulva]UJO14736.1 Peptidyl-prolyl cis-trans isomerase H [Fulvia fulva]
MTTNRPRVFLDVSIGQEPAGRLTIELFADKAPKTCENFRQLCTGEHDGLSYARVPFHRVIDEFMVQGGDIEKGDGTGTKSVYGGEFEDENLDWREMDAAGLVCSANRGKDTNGSQFFLTLEPCPHLNGKHTIFGRLVSGEDTLARVAKVPVDKNDRPVEPVLVSKCGELERKTKAKRHSQQESVAPVHHDDRGRRRKSDQDAISENEMDASPPPEKPRKTRRQSDNVIDEGKRGRPRLRSASRSPSQPIEEELEDASDHSPAKMHKRKRSPSPSRHLDRRDEEATFERRRRSLPNQYKDHQDRRNADEDRYRPSPRRDGHNYSGRQRGNDRYRPGRDRYDDHGRLGDDGRTGGGHENDHHHAPPVKFKGRGSMKYREPGRL